MKHDVGDLVARMDHNGYEIKLGYISDNITSDTFNGGYFVYFFDWGKRFWYSEKEINTLKLILERWKNK
jgi:hypothetical protein